MCLGGGGCSKHHWGDIPARSPQKPPNMRACSRITGGTMKTLGHMSSRKGAVELVGWKGLKPSCDEAVGTVMKEGRSIPGIFLVDAPCHQRPKARQDGYDSVPAALGGCEAECTSITLEAKGPALQGRQGEGKMKGVGTWCAGQGPAPQQDVPHPSPGDEGGLCLPASPGPRLPTPPCRGGLRPAGSSHSG